MSDRTPRRYSTIIPTLNEESRIATSIGSVRELDAGMEIIVSDGGSVDDTTNIARSLGALVVDGSRGRGAQCNAGARMTNADILIFLHADTLLPAEAIEAVEVCFDDPRVNVATFRLDFDAGHWLLKLYGSLTRFDSIFTSFGDQCIVIRRDFFLRLGGFPNWLLLEDVHLLRMARQHTRVAKISATVTSSARRFLRRGILRCQWNNGYLLMKYLMGVANVTHSNEREVKANSQPEPDEGNRSLSKEWIQRQ